MNKYHEDIPVVILCGGRGTRLNEETEFRPKPLVPIGEKPIIWHIMKHYSTHGFKKFILCLGYKGDSIKDYFKNYYNEIYDFSLDLKSGKETHFGEKIEKEDWEITFAHTGIDTQTGGRIIKIKKYLENYPNFLLTYGDGVSNVDITKLYSFHKNKDKLCTITGIKPNSKYGIIKINDESEALKFVEKPAMEDYISGGFMVFKKEFLDELNDDMFEVSVLPKLAENKEIVIFKHEGFWHSMDTYKDYLDLNKMLKDGKAGWITWK